MTNKRPPDATVWIIRNGQPALVNLWTNSSYRHCSDWDYNHYIEAVDGSFSFRTTNSTEDFGHKTREEAIADFNLFVQNDIRSLEEKIKRLKGLLITN